MSDLIHLAELDGLGRDVFYVSVPSFSSIPARFDLPTEKFVLFIACDANNISTADISDWAEKMLDSGAVYICTWGKDCERVHDVIDEVDVEREIETEGKLPFVMTTWHSKETLDDALWFALMCTEPYEDSDNASIATVILNVNDDARGEHLRKILTDLKKFIEVDDGKLETLEATD